MFVPTTTPPTTSTTAAAATPMRAPGLRNQRSEARADADPRRSRDAEEDGAGAPVTAPPEVAGRSSVTGAGLRSSSVAALGATSGGSCGVASSMAMMSTLRRGEGSTGSAVQARSAAVARSSSTSARRTGSRSRRASNSAASSASTAPSAYAAVSVRMSSSVVMMRPPSRRAGGSCRRADVSSRCRWARRASTRPRCGCSRRSTRGRRPGAGSR